MRKSVNYKIVTRGEFKSKLMKVLRTLLVGCFALLFWACDKEVEKGVFKSDLSKDVELNTDYGTIILRLSDETPIHRNNFIKLVNQKSYANVSFHRIIEKFLIQSGDMDTKYAQPEKNTLELPYLIDAEIKTNLFHKRGALNAARMGDNHNPGRSSSGTQFTIIQGRIYTDSTLAITEKRINKWLAYNTVINKPEHKTAFEKLLKLSNKMEDISIAGEALNSAETKIIADSINTLKSKFDALAVAEETTMEPYSFPEEHRKIYKTIGGAAHLDQNYTVFGEVVKGMSIVDSIAKVNTDDKDKPLDDVRIISAKMIDRKQY